MLKLAGRLTLSLLGAASILATTPAAAVPLVEEAPEIIQCSLAPGIYSIMDSEGNLVAILIVYPNCTYEIVVKEDIPKQGEI
jgi:hypothetical protein